LGGGEAGPLFTASKGNRKIVDSQAAEALLREVFITGATLGTGCCRGHRIRALCPLPMYWLLEKLPSTRQSARRLGLVTIDQMIGALIDSVKHPTDGVCLVEVPQIR